MDITIKCQLSLSKKLRALIQEGETRVSLVASSITDGRGEATLRISSDKKINTVSDFIGKETSIMLVPLEMQNVSVNNDAVSSIFSKAPKSPKPTTPVGKRPSVERMAVVEPPEDDGDEAWSVKTQEEIQEEIPEAFEETKQPAFKRYINTMAELDLAIKAAKNKSSDIDIDSIQDARKRAEAIELKERSEAIDVDAFIVNDKCANLAINDLGINLVLNAPYNLANISAKRILCSRELKAMFNQGLVKFIKPEEINSYVKRAERAIENPTLEVFSSPEEAGEHMERSGMNVERMDMSIDDLARPSDTEMILTNLTSRPAVKSGGVTKTVHGNTSARPTRPTSQDQQENPKGIKTIRRSGLNF